MDDYPATLNDGSLPPIRKHTLRKWKTLPTTGSSVGIPDPSLKQGYLGDLKKKSKIELEELLRRQDKLLSDVKFVGKLRDGGERLRGRRQELQESLAAISAASATAEATVVRDINSLEWQWRDNSKHVSSRYQGINNRIENSGVVDSDDDTDDDDDADPLKLMAAHSRDIPLTTVAKCVSQTAKQVDKNGSGAYDPAEAIREELRQLEIDDHCEKQEKDVADLLGNLDEQKGDITNLSANFCSKLLLSYEEKNANIIHKKVFKPFRARNQQETFPSLISNMSSNNKVSQIDSAGESINTDLSSNTIIDNTCTTGIPKQIQSANLNPDSTSSVTINDKCYKNCPIFGSAPEFQKLKKVNISPSTWHKSPLWSCESSATGRLSSFGEASRSIKLLPMRESLELEKSAHERKKKLQLDEAAERLARVAVAPSTESNTYLKPAKRYTYRDINETGHFLNDQGYYESDDIPQFIDENPRYDNNSSDDENSDCD